MAQRPVIQPPNQRYKYKKPRRINWVSILVIAALLGAGYSGWKFVPVYWKRGQVDGVLQDAKLRASDLHLMNSDPGKQYAEANKILNETVNRIVALGINTIPVEQGGNGLVVYYDQGYAAIHAKYTVVVKHLLGKTTTFRFDRKQKIPSQRMRF